MERISLFLIRLRHDLKKKEIKKSDFVTKFIIGQMVVKGAVLWLLSLSVFPLFSRFTIIFLYNIARRTHIFSNARFVTSFFLQINETPQRRFLAYSVVFLLWGALDLIEAIGLWQRKKWAEYLATVGTALFVPVEFYSIITHYTLEKLIITVFNIFLVLYFVKTRKLFQFDRQ